jgi:hypothetical protein
MISSYADEIVCYNVVFIVAIQLRHLLWSVYSITVCMFATAECILVCLRSNRITEAKFRLRSDEINAGVVTSK